MLSCLLDQLFFMIFKLLFHIIFELILIVNIYFDFAYYVDALKQITPSFVQYFYFQIVIRFSNMQMNVFISMKI